MNSPVANHVGFEVTDRGPWISTATGGRFYPLFPSPDEVLIDDIAISLAHLCRYNGHTSRFYSVAEHSCLMAQYAFMQGDSELAAYCLLHDAAEAFVGDMVRPMKHAIPQFEPIEKDVWLAIAEKFGLDPKMPPGVHDLDMRMCAAEKAALLPHVEPWPNMPPPLDVKILPVAQPLERWRDEFYKLAYILLDKSD